MKHRMLCRRSASRSGRHARLRLVSRCVAVRGEGRQVGPTATSFVLADSSSHEPNLALIPGRL